MVNKLFYELIRLSIGTQDSLSRTPQATEWSVLYQMATKQSLVGVCFAGVQRMCNSDKELYAGMNKQQYLTWMGMAAKIQHRNKMVNEQCVALQRRLSENGWQSCVLKGQAIAQSYNSNLSFLRQSGDIDLLIPGGVKAAKKMMSEFGLVSDFDYVHCHLAAFEDTSEVEIHHRAGCLQNLWANSKYQRWARKNAFEGVRVQPLANGEIKVPSAEFEIVFLLAHMYKHIFSEGLGLRQMMDFHFALKALPSSVNARCISTIEMFGLKRFAQGVMWIMIEVFGTTKRYLLCKPNEKVGSFLLNDIMQVGNFGHYDEKHKGVGHSVNSRMITHILRRNWHYFRLFPVDVLWCPLWIAYQSLYRKVIVNWLKAY